MKLKRWLGWINLLDYFYMILVKMLRNVKNKWKITKVKFKKQDKDQQAKGVL
jgi:hypothetical protein